MRPRSHQWMKCPVCRIAVSNWRRRRLFSIRRLPRRRSTRCWVRRARLQSSERVRPGMAQPVAIAFPRKVSDRFVALESVTRLARGMAHRRRFLLVQEREKRKKTYANSWRVSSRVKRTLQLQRQREVASTYHSAKSVTGPDTGPCVTDVRLQLRTRRGGRRRWRLVQMWRD